MLFRVILLAISLILFNPLSAQDISLEEVKIFFGQRKPEILLDLSKEGWGLIGVNGESEMFFSMDSTFEGELYEHSGLTLFFGVREYSPESRDIEDALILDTPHKMTYKTKKRKEYVEMLDNISATNWVNVDTYTLDEQNLVMTRFGSSEYNIIVEVPATTESKFYYFTIYKKNFSQSEKAQINSYIQDDPIRDYTWSKKRYE